MKSYSFPYGAGEWDARITVELTDEEAALVEASMQAEHFRMDEDDTLTDIELRIMDNIIEQNKKTLIDIGRLDELREEYPDMGDDELGLE